MPINSFLYPGAKVTPAYEVANSCRFNSADSAYMHKSQSGGNRRTFTLSFWIKRGKIGNNQKVFTAGTSGTEAGFQFYDGSTENTLRFYEYTGSDVILLAPNRLFRDPSAWMHICVAVDTTQGVAANRVKYYTNGVQETSFATATYPSENYDTLFNNSGSSNFVGFLDSHSAYFDGYMAEVCLIDGQALAPTSFGEFDSDSPTIWKPKDVSGLTFGNNGFYLDFEDSSNLGNDANGGTDFTESGLAATDQATDTPTNNFAVMNPLANKIAASTFSEGNLKIAHSSAKGGNLSTIGFSTGKWYAEMKIVGIPTDERWHWGILPHDCHVADDPVNTGNDGIMLSAFNATIYANTGSGHAIINTFYGEDQTRFDSFSGILGLALDATSGTKTIAISKAGAWITGSDATDTDFSNALKVDISTAFARYPHWHIATGTGTTGANGVYSLNFGSPEISITSGNADANGYGNFEYPVPSGYYALCTKNLAEYG